MRRIVALICFLFCVTSAIGGLTGYQTVQARCGGMLYAVDAGTSFARASAEQIREWEEAREYPAEFTAWRQKSAKWVSSFDGDRSVRMPVIEISGSSEHLLPYGKILQESDQSGCILGEKSAERLFGSRDVAGLSITYQGRDYTVRGTVEEPQDFLMVQAAEDTTFDRIVFARNPGDDAADQKTVAEQFFLRYNLSAQPVFRAGFLESVSVRGFLPGKWSDFSGWKDNFSDYRSKRQKIETIPKSVFEIAAAEKQARAVCLLAVSGVFLAAGIIVYRKRT